jgi:hypothetical protein
MKEERAAIPEQMTGRVMENLGGRLEQCLRSGRRHLMYFSKQNGRY